VVEVTDTRSTHASVLCNDGGCVTVRRFLATRTGQFIYDAEAAEIDRVHNIYVAFIEVSGTSLKNKVTLYGMAGSVGKPIQQPGTCIWKRVVVIRRLRDVLTNNHLFFCDTISTIPYTDMLQNPARQHYRMLRDVCLTVTSSQPCIDTASANQVVNRTENESSESLASSMTNVNECYIAAAMGTDVDSVRTHLGEYVAFLRATHAPSALTEYLTIMGTLHGFKISMHECIKMEARRLLHTQETMDRQSQEVAQLNDVVKEVVCRQSSERWQSPVLHNTHGREQSSTESLETVESVLQTYKFRMGNVYIILDFDKQPRGHECASYVVQAVMEAMHVHNDDLTQSIKNVVITVATEYVDIRVAITKIACILDMHRGTTPYVFIVSSTSLASDVNHNVLGRAYVEKLDTRVATLHPSTLGHLMDMSSYGDHHTMCKTQCVVIRVEYVGIDGVRLTPCLRLY
jgi:hypothetical protein